LGTGAGTNLGLNNSRTGSAHHEILCGGAHTNGPMPKWHGAPHNSIDTESKHKWIVRLTKGTQHIGGSDWERWTHAGDSRRVDKADGCLVHSRSSEPSNKTVRSVIPIGVLENAPRMRLMRYMELDGSAGKEDTKCDSPIWTTFKGILGERERERGNVCEFLCIRGIVSRVGYCRIATHL